MQQSCKKIKKIFQSKAPILKYFLRACEMINNFSLIQIESIVFHSIQHIGVKGEKCWLPAFSPFTTMCFFERIFLRLVKTRNCQHHGFLLWLPH